MGMFWETMRLLEGHYQKALQEHKLEYAEGIHDALKRFDELQPATWVKTQDRMPQDGTDVWTWDGKTVSIDNYKASRSNYGHVIDETGQVVPTTGWWHHYTVYKETPRVTHWMPITEPSKPQE